jgi:glycine/D-amino acid oxidase-like deaminating enzyme
MAQNSQTSKETSTWLAHTELPSFPKLTQNIETDVTIAGGGLAGLLSAYLIAKDGKRVVVLEKDRLARLGTGFTTGFLSAVIDTDVVDQIPMWGDEGAKLIWKSHSDAIDLIERICKKEKIDAEFVRCDNYAYANDRKEAREFEAEFAVMKRLSFPVLMKPIELGFKTTAVITTRKQAKYDVVKFLAGLVPVLEAMGVQIFEKSEVTEIEDGGADEAQLLPFSVRANGKEVTAQWVLTATYQPFNNPREVALQKGMYRTYILELEVPKGKYPEAIYEDGDNPYHYFRVDAEKGNKGRDRIIIGGEDHREELTNKKMMAKSYTALKDYARELFGKEYPIVRQWSGLILEPVDGIAFMGEYDPHKLIATAFSGNGMTYSAISAMINRDLIAGKINPYAVFYDPKRSMTMTQLWKKGRDYTEEFFRGAVANLFKDSDRAPRTNETT